MESNANNRPEFWRDENIPHIELRKIDDVIESRMRPMRTKNGRSVQSPRANAHTQTVQITTKLALAH